MKIVCFFPSHFISIPMFSYFSVTPSSSLLCFPSVFSYGEGKGIGRRGKVRSVDGLLHQTSHERSRKSEISTRVFIKFMM